MPYFSGGSVLNIMKFGYPQVRQPACGATRVARNRLIRLPCLQGLEEPVIATIIDAVLKALSYFHRNGNIHRDIKVRARKARDTLNCTKEQAHSALSPGGQHFG